MKCQNTAFTSQEAEQAMVVQPMELEEDSVGFFRGKPLPKQVVKHTNSVVEVQPMELEEDAVGFFRGKPLPMQVVTDVEKLQTAMGFDPRLVAMFKILDRNNNNTIEASELFASMKDIRLALGLEHPKSLTDIMRVFAF